MKKRTTTDRGTAPALKTAASSSDHPSKRMPPEPSAPSSLIEPYRNELSHCVKCGACRAVCPTFLQGREESLSARGRMALVKAVFDRRLPVSTIYKDRLTTCTGCLACEAACPSGVPVTEIIQAAKEQSALEAGAGIVNAAISGVVRHPVLFRAAAWLAPLLLHYMKPGPGKSEKDGEQAARKTFPGNGKRGRVAFFAGCAVSYWQQDIGRSLVAVMNRLGHDVIVPEGLKCCGRPLLSLGDRKAAEELAAHNAMVMAALDVDEIVTACASCGLTFKREYPKLLRPGVRRPRVVDIHEWLRQALKGAELTPVRTTITWHDPCHLGRGQGLAGIAREILGLIPGLTLVEMKNADRCCGFGGVMRVTRSELSNDIAEDKVKNIRATGASVVATGCPACRMQIADALTRAGSDVAVVHTVHLLEEALAPESKETGPRVGTRVRKRKNEKGQP